MRIDQDISDQDSVQFPSTNEQLGRYLIQGLKLKLLHDDKRKNDMEHEDDEYISDGTN
jgi:hypothetical protein